MINNNKYGKATENTWNRMDKGLAMNDKYYQKSAYKQTFVSKKIFDKSLKTVQKIKKVLIPNQSILYVYVRFK